MTVAGKPLSVGEIHFIPDTRAGNSGPMAIGALQPNGRFQLVDPGKHRGVIPGDHVVYFTMPTPGPQPPVPERVNGEVVLRHQPPVEVARIPRQYLRAASSPLWATVTEEGENQFEFSIE